MSHHLEPDVHESDEAGPRPSSLIETLRAIGYSIQTAIADIIDNSISASAKNVRVRFEWLGEDSWIEIADDGLGMNAQELVDAMRPGSKSPSESRDTKDLGRFGLGLKTASFSQCRLLTVISKKADFNVCSRSWDLDYVQRTDRWVLVEYPVSEKDKRTLEANGSGTIVRWHKVDRLVKESRTESEEDRDHFLRIMTEVRDHLRMVFHRFLEQGKLKIWLNGRQLEPWDPFLRGETATQALPEEPFLDGSVRVKPYVLPHHSKLTPDAFKMGSGSAGWNAQQGFYIYRNERLLVPGTWLGMFKKEEHTKLARIMIDIQNSVDTAWQIDIKKSSARPPARLRDALRSIGKLTRSRAQEIYRHKGRVIQRKFAHQFSMVWLERVKHGSRFYEINRQHPTVSRLLDTESASRTEIGRLLRLVEETVPLTLITLRESENPDRSSIPFSNSADTDLLSIAKEILENLCRSGMDRNTAKRHLLGIEPFNYYPDILDNL